MPPVASAGSTDTRGVIRSSTFGKNQFDRPSRCISEGTRIVRSTNASRNTAPARPTPNSFTERFGSSTKPANTAIMMIAAAVMMPPVAA